MTISDSPPGAFVAQLSWPEIEARLREGVTALLPVGAAAKEHGAHLPMNTDWLQAQWLAREVAQRATVLVWPTVGYGFYPAFTDFPGSVSLSRETFARTIEEIVECMFGAGARTLLILNTGISTIAPIEEAISRSPHSTRIRLAHIYRGRRYLETAAALAREPRGGHGGECETSIMLAIAPEQVDMGKARPWTREGIGPGKFVRDDPAHPNYCPDGHYGDPTLATREKGQALLQAMLEDVLELLG